MRKVGIKRDRAWNILEKIHSAVICSLLSITKLYLKYHGYYINIYFKRRSKYVKKGSCFSQSWNPDAESPTSTVSVVSYSAQRYRYPSNLEFESALCFGFLTDFTMDIASPVQAWCGEAFFLSDIPVRKFCQWHPFHKHEQLTCLYIVWGSLLSFVFYLMFTN